jgi:hypothetical protein
METLYELYFDEKLDFEQALPADALQTRPLCSAVKERRIC